MPRTLATSFLVNAQAFPAQGLLALRFARQDAIFNAFTGLNVNRLGKTWKNDSRVVCLPVFPSMHKTALLKAFLPCVLLDRTRFSMLSQA